MSDQPKNALFIDVDGSHAILNEFSAAEFRTLLKIQANSFGDCTPSEDFARSVLHFYEGGNLGEGGITWLVDHWKDQMELVERHIEAYARTFPEKCGAALAAHVAKEDPAVARLASVEQHSQPTAASDLTRMEKALSKPTPKVPASEKRSPKRAKGAA